MNSKRALFILEIHRFSSLLPAAGLKTAVCTVNCGGSGNASLTISLYDTPPTGTQCIELHPSIAGISLTPSSSEVPSLLTTALSSVEVTRLRERLRSHRRSGFPSRSGLLRYQRDALCPTSSTNIFSLTFGSTITYGTHSCVNGAICALPVGAIYTISIPLTLNLTANQKQWIGLDFNLNKAITSSGGISVRLLPDRRSYASRDYTNRHSFGERRTPCGRFYRGRTDLRPTRVAASPCIPPSATRR